MALNREERLRLADIDPELSETLKKIKFPEIPEGSDPSKVIAGVRAYQVQHHVKPAPGNGVSEQDIYYSARDGYKLRARVFQSANIAVSSIQCPLVMYFHGGGFTVGSPEDTAPFCRQLVQKLGVVCIAPSYRLAPENPFPVSINDAWDGLQWIASNVEAVLPSVLLSRGFIVGGSSAGATLSAILAHLARDEGLKNPLTGTFLLAPMIIMPETLDILPSDWKYKEMYLSRTQAECKKDPILSPVLQEVFYAAEKGDPHSPMFVPFIWPKGHANLPPTYFQVCGLDVLRDEDLIYEQVLREENGVKTRLNIYPGMPHTFWNSFSQLTQGRKASQDLEDGLQWLLASTSP